ncbi:MAG: phosphatidate cytidylyltransferase [Flavobacteriales bacterium]|nr:phosphatidate cytidylyltransferase [Flavobacteriales bacterium]MBK7246802.1 phosphatidate cytidylyltransferase [Flavobacteriales bacterium]QQS72477.1 MAG: phosphatidate cytidylyltransferase [Flavobacteriales bacterium]HQV39465.1 phosphatidate cytidylyltransferase [Flavobacteriales bacterium]HQW33399.1 phosphatidate cytidylyltransferase [Flavobacteriales bacterium]
MTETATRALTGAAYVALTLGAALAGPLTTTLLFLPVSLLAAREMHRLSHATKEETPPVTIPLLVTAATFLTIAFLGTGLLSLRSSAVVLLAAFTVGVVDIVLNNAKEPVRGVGTLLIMIAYIAMPFGLITSLLTDGPHLFIGFMIILWTNDTGAYLVGRAIGRTKLMPRVSPKKTVEGFGGGLVLAMMAGVVLALAWPDLTLAQWVICAAVVAVTSTIGDLLESSFKREAGVKDSGHVLPGHGGILDRFDGFLLALPAMLACAKLMGA